MRFLPILAIAASVTALMASAKEDYRLPVHSPTKIIGEVAENKPSPPMPRKVLPNFEVNWSTEYQKKDHKIIVNNVQAPPRVVKSAVVNVSAEETFLRQEEHEKSLNQAQPDGGTYMVSATIYDHKTSYVRWRHEGEEFAVYSNVDWNYLGGFHAFEGRGKHYGIILFSWNSSMTQLRKEMKDGYRVSLPYIPDLPPLSKRGAAYMVVKGDENNDAAMEFIEAIHDLYAEHQSRLKKAWKEREKNLQIHKKQRERLKRNPLPQEDVIINYWIEKVDKKKYN